MIAKEIALKALQLLDLTSLGDNDDQAGIAALCNRAVTPYGQVAAVCVWPRFVGQCHATLRGTGVRIAAVANFPAGGSDIESALEETREIVAAGGDEVDLVLPYAQWLAGEREPAKAMVAACRDICPEAVRLKVILETGSLGGVEDIAAASRDAIDAGADFVKTSTGKTSVSATPEAARAMLQVIRDTARPVGFKASGGIRTGEQAVVYLDLAESIMGSDWASVATFRFGASGLLDDLLATIEDRHRQTTKEGY